MGESRGPKLGTPHHATTARRRKVHAEVLMTRPAPIDRNPSGRTHVPGGGGGQLAPATSAHHATHAACVARARHRCRDERICKADALLENALPRARLGGPCRDDLFETQKLTPDTADTLRKRALAESVKSVNTASGLQRRRPQGGSRIASRPQSRDLRTCSNADAPSRTSQAHDMRSNEDEIWQADAARNPAELAGRTSERRARLRKTPRPPLPRA